MKKVPNQNTALKPQVPYCYTLTPHSACSLLKVTWRLSPSQGHKIGPQVPARGRSWQAGSTRARGTESHLRALRPTIPSSSLCRQKTQAPERRFKSPDRTSRHPCISGKAHSKQTALTAQQRVGSGTQHANWSPAVPLIRLGGALGTKSSSSFGKFVLNTGWLHRKGSHLRTLSLPLSCVT